MKRSTLRPISARLLKSAIDSIRPWIQEAEVLELFAGSGRFGIRLLEEGAIRVLFVESHRPTAIELEKATIRFSNAGVIVEDAFSYLRLASKDGDKFDILFADPPFSNWSKNFSKQLFEQVASVSSPGAIFLVKHPTQMVAFSMFFDAWKTVTVGESRLSFYTYGDRK